MHLLDSLDDRLSGSVVNRTFPPLWHCDDAGHARPDSFHHAFTVILHSRNHRPDLVLIAPRRLAIIKVGIRKIATT
jgi:hypothetical protein